MMIMMMLRERREGENVGLYRERRLFGNELLRERGWFVLPMKCFMVFGDDDVDDDVYRFIPVYSVPKTQKKEAVPQLSRK